jgi:glycolate oxidase iron-sulfur subunit
MFRNEALAEEAKAVSEIAMDVSEVLMKLDLPEGAPKGLRRLSRGLLAAARPADQDLSQGPAEAAGLQGGEPVDSHLCCGSAGTYNLMQPEISGQLKARKVETLEMTKPDIIAAGNIGCMMQIGSGTEMPIVHTVELLDWATGGPRPPALDAPGKREVPVPILR